MTEALRLSKYVAQQFHYSRREAELLIEGGWVMVDGVVEEAPQFLVGEQVVTIHPHATLEPPAPATLLLHKPAGCPVLGKEGSSLSMMTPATRAMEDGSGMRVLRKHFSRLQALLPLEDAACGLQVYSQDYGVVRKLSDEAARMEQEFVVEVTGTLAPGGLALLSHGLEYQGRAVPPCKVSWQSETRLRFALKAPLPGQIVALCARVGLTVVSMKRIRIGRIPMGNLPEGQWMYLARHLRF